ncbi:MAG: lysozyme [Micrococcales bacterium]|nr:lysozyme [Micrococcales bacterium]
MKVSAKCLTLIKHHEGVRNKPYQCPASLWTVGVGHVMYPEQVNLAIPERKKMKLKPGDNRAFSNVEVDAILAADLARFERGVLRLCTRRPSQSQFDAMVCLSFNIGLGGFQRSSVRMRHNRGDVKGAAEEFMKWTKGGGKVLPGLVKRRRDEMLMYLSSETGEENGSG